ncbi:MAG: 50S ribosomal protein L18 [Phycisphaerales bacterium]
MDKNRHKAARRTRRHIGIRKSVIGTPLRPRLCVYKSLRHMYAQIIDDLAGRTLVSASTLELEGEAANKAGNAKSAADVGTLLAKKAKDAGVSDVAFDRAGFKYHGRVKALADAARKGGLKF